MQFDLIYIAIAIFLASVVEGVVLYRYKNYNWRSFGVSAANLVVRTLLLVAVPFSIAEPLVPFLSEHALFKIPLQGWEAFLLLFFLQDFCYYWYHRCAHRIRWFWASHSVHHSPNELTLSAEYRSSSFSVLTGNTLFFLPLIWIGFSADAVMAAFKLNVLYQFWLHVTWIPKLGWLEYVINTPSAHRVHHASNVEYLDSNYGGVLIIFDRLFGTYKPELETLPCRYGLVHTQRSYNLLRVEFDPWIELAKDLRSARGVREFFGVLLRPPGWRPDVPGETVEELRQRAYASVSAS